MLVVYTFYQFFTLLFSEFVRNPGLELLLELQALESSVVIEWPQGEKLRVSHNADLKDFNLSIQRQQDWFAATGELKLNNDLVLDMQKQERNICRFWLRL